MGGEVGFVLQSTIKHGKRLVRKAGVQAFLCLLIFIIILRIDIVEKFLDFPSKMEGFSSLFQLSSGISLASMAVMPRPAIFLSDLRISKSHIAGLPFEEERRILLDRVDDALKEIRGYEPESAWVNCIYYVSTFAISTALLIVASFGPNILLPNALGIYFISLCLIVPTGHIVALLVFVAYVRKEFYNMVKFTRVHYINKNDIDMFILNAKHLPNRVRDKFKGWPYW